MKTFSKRRGMGVVAAVFFLAFMGIFITLMVEQGNFLPRYRTMLREQTAMQAIDNYLTQYRAHSEAGMAAPVLPEYISVETYAGGSDFINTPESRNNSIGGQRLAQTPEKVVTYTRAGHTVKKAGKYSPITMTMQDLQYLHPEESMDMSASAAITAVSGGEDVTWETLNMSGSSAGFVHMDGGDTEARGLKAVLSTPEFTQVEYNGASTIYYNRGVSKWTIVEINTTAFDTHGDYIEAVFSTTDVDPEKYNNNHVWYVNGAPPFANKVLKINDGAPILINPAIARGSYPMTIYSGNSVILLGTLNNFPETE